MTPSTQLPAVSCQLPATSNQQPTTGSQSSALTTAHSALKGASESRTPLSLTVLWVVGAISFVAIVLVFTPFTYMLDDIKQTIQFVMAPIVGALLAVAILCRHTRPVHRWLGITLLAYILLGLLSTLLADFRWLAWQEWAFELTLIVGFATVAFTATTVARFKSFCLFFFLVGCVTIAFGLFHYLGGLGWVFHRLYPRPPTGEAASSPLFALLMTLDRNRLMLSTILNRDFYSAYLVMIAPLAVALCLDSHRLLGCIFYAVAGLLYCLSIVLAQSNDSILALIVMFVLLSVLLARNSKARLPSRLWKTWTIGAAVLLVTTLFVFRSHFAVLPSLLYFAIRSRSILWSGAWHIFCDPSQPRPAFLHHLIVGSGPGGYLELFPYYRNPHYHMWGIAPITQFSHCQSLDLLCERGLLGTIVFAAFLGGILWLLLRQVRRHRDSEIYPYQVALFVATIGISIQNLTSPNIRWTVCGLNYWFLLGLATAAVRLGEPRPDTPLIAHRSSLSTLCGRLAAISFLVAMLVFEALAVPFGLRRFAAAVCNNRGRAKMSDMSLLVGEMGSLPDGERKEKYRLKAIECAHAAEADLHRSLQWLPSFLSSYYLLGNVYGHDAALANDLMKGIELRKRAIETYDRLASLAPEYADIHTGIGLLYQDAFARLHRPEDKQLALAHLEKAALMSTALPGQLLYAHTLEAMNEPQRALTVYWRLLERGNEYVSSEAGRVGMQEAFSVLYTAARQDRNPEQLVTLYRRWLDLVPLDSSVFVELIELLHLQGRDAEALRRCRDWIEINPLDPLPRNLAAKILWDDRAPRRAINQLEAIVRLQSRRIEAGPWWVPESDRISELRDPRPENIWFRLGQAIEKLGSTSEALSCYRRSFEAAPQSKTAVQARQAFETLRARTPLNPKSEIRNPKSTGGGKT
jgi:tetratricopeptide (TPR) repeat protein